MLIALVLTALADIPPPPDYIETCTIDQQCGGRPGVACGDAYHGDRDACERQYASQGYSKACQTAGASTWTEVWCQSTTVVDPGEPTQPVADDPVTPEPATVQPMADVPATPERSKRCAAIDSSAWLGFIVPLLYVRRRGSSVR